MEVFISRNGTLFGQWTDEQVHALYRAAILLPTDHYWIDGMPAWRSLASADEPPKPKGPPPLPIDTLKLTTKIVADDRPPVPLPKQKPVVAPPPVIPVKTGPKPPALPVTPKAKPASPPPYVYSAPAKTILQLLSPEMTERKKSALQGKSDFSKVEWLVPEGRTTPFGVPPIPVTTSNVQVVDGQVEAQKNGASYPRTRRKISLPSAWTFGVWCLALALVALFIIIGRRDKGHSIQTNSKLTFADIQDARSGHLLFDPRSTDEAATKFEGGTLDQTDWERTKSEITGNLLHALALRLIACEEAERPLAELGMEPSKLISLKALDARSAAVVSAQSAVHDMLDFLNNLDDNAKAQLAAKSIGHADSDDYVAYLNDTGERRQLIAYWQHESAYLGDLLANLNLLKSSWGKWHVAPNGSVAIDDPAALASYTACIKKAQTDLAEEKSAQDDEGVP